MSCLITTAFAPMEKVINQLQQNGLRKSTFVIIGGGVTTDLVRTRIGADAQTQDPTYGIRLCQQYLKK
jgi:methanogenic corrinoid protein MtbC1